MPVRIFILAKELDMTSKELIAFLHTQGHRPASHMSNVEDTVAQILRDRLKPKIQKERAAKEKQAAGAAKAKGAIAEAPPEVGRADRRPAAAAKQPRAGAAPREKRDLGSEAPSRAARSGKDSGRGPKDAPDGDWDKKGKDKEKEKEAPRLRRFFPSQEDVYDSGPRFGGVRRKLYGKPRKTRTQREESPVAVTERPQKVEVTTPISVRELSSLMGIKAQSIITSLWQQGHKLNINQSLDDELVTTVGIEFGVDIEFKKKEVGIEETLRNLEDHASLPEELVPRAPVVTFLGHVDHGKTSLLDRIRKTKVTAKEAGGITQHLGAYRVDKEAVHVVFIDTPGHHAFTEMRARGANVTDVAVLVVAADDGVMPQTEEAISHARAASVPIVVAVNKVDKPNANPMQCKQQLAGLGLQPVEWGGDTEFVEVSALTGQGVDTLLETLSLTSEILELKANPNRRALGVVLEAQSSASMGVLVTLLVREGTLHHGDCVLCGTAAGRVRGMWLNGVERIQEAGPSTPVMVTGLNRVPEAGDKFYVFENLERPRQIAEERLSHQTQGRTIAVPLTWEDEIVPEFRVVLKADVQGTLEALRSSLDDLSTDEVKLKILHAQVGGINHADIVLADAFHAVVLGFNVSPDEQARSLAEEKRIEIRRYEVIYKLVEDVRAALEGKLAPQMQEEIHGHAEIRQIFKASKVGSIAGCMVTDGFVARNDQVRLKRGDEVLHAGSLASLKRFKDDVKEVKAGFDCGLKLADYEDIKVGDTLEAYAVVEKPRQL